MHFDFLILLNIITETLAKYLCDLKNTAMWGGHLEVSHTPFKSSLEIM